MVDDFPLLVSLLARILLGAVFLLAAFQKLRDRSGFARALANYTPIPAGVRKVAAVSLPWGELVLGAWLASGILAPVAVSAAALVLAGFALVAVWSFGKGTADCGCLGSLLKGGTGYQIALRNVGLAVLAVPVVLTSEGIEPVADLAIGAIVSVALVVATLRLFPERTARHGEHEGHSHRSAGEPIGRRSFLGRAALLASAVAGVGLGMGRLGKAEAACAACETCSPMYVFIGCSDYCCGLFWTRKMKFCDGACFSCSAWTTIQYCGLSQCC